MSNLLDRGIAPEDISLIAHITGDKVAKGVTVDYEPALAGVERVRERIPTPLGDPSKLLEDVSGVEELDDAAEVEENISEPLNNEWYGLQQEREALLFAETGGMGSKAHHRHVAEKIASQMSSITIGGEAVLLGDGKLATNLLADQILNPSEDVTALVKKTLWKLGLAPDPSLQLSKCFLNGGSVLTVAETASAMSIQDLEAMVNASNPLMSGTFVDTETVTPVPHS